MVKKLLQLILNRTCKLSTRFEVNALATCEAGDKSGSSRFDVLRGFLEKDCFRLDFDAFQKLAK